MNGYITLTVPAEVTLTSGFTCSLVVTNTSSAVSASLPLPTTSVISGTSNIITFNFTSIATVSADQPAGTIFTIVITSLKNYYSFKPINAQLKVFAGDGSSIE